MDSSSKIDLEKFADYMKNIPMPEKPPIISDELKDKIVTSTKDEFPKISTLIEKLELSWLSSHDNRLGVTTFSGDYNEIYRKKRLNLPLGVIKIKLHPVLIDDRKLFNHTLVHEILHASGMFDHSEIHDELTNKIAPAPSLSESIVLRYLQAIMISTTNVLSWECSSCNHIWTRNTFLKPKFCPKCSSLMN
tara:strand:+ start:812 stop:1384 length:573 start_codon:yes stop_codon:yes gene_type:complete